MEKQRGGELDERALGRRMPERGRRRDDNLDTPLAVDADDLDGDAGCAAARDRQPEHRADQEQQREPRSQSRFHTPIVRVMRRKMVPTA